MDLYQSPQRQYFSPLYYSQYKVTLPIIKEYAKGDLIDLGCGLIPYRSLIQDQVVKYDTLDIQQHDAKITFIGDIQDMSFIESKSYDTALCMEVLEHVPDPSRALKEIHRILRSDGLLILSVPHLSRIHDEPLDFQRFTRYGIEAILAQHNFSIMELKIRGGLFSFLGHQISTIILGIFWSVPIVNKLVFLLNSFLVTRLCFHLDKITDKSGIFAAGYSVVAKKNP
jgi:SAM-dependent methyltransferase